MNEGACIESTALDAKAVLFSPGPIVVICIILNSPPTFSSINLWIVKVLLSKEKKHALRQHNLSQIINSPSF